MVTPGSLRRRLMVVGLSAALCACSSLRPVGPEYQTPASKTTSAWQAQQPHGGELVRLSDWWQQFQDPILVELIASAQQASGSLAEAASRIIEARSALVKAGAGQLPSLDATASQTRGPITFGGPPILRTQDQLQLQSSWEIDLFGAQLRERQAASARVDSRQAQWHEARVSLAAEVATQYASLRACERQVQIDEIDLASRQETARITQIGFNAGLQSSANAALARAGAADQASRLRSQQAQCDLMLKAIVALTGAEEARLRLQLSDRAAQLPRPRQFLVASVPAQLISQRPDLVSAERELAAASADIGVATADQYPRLSLLGSIGPLRFSASGVTLNTTTWSIGPSITMPIFDNGRRAASVVAAQARYNAALVVYQQKIRQAVREVEEALVRLSAADAQVLQAQSAASDYRAALTAASQRWEFGFGSLLELEDSRRLTLQADTALANLQRERVQAWIALYRALGGGWEGEQTATVSPSPAAPSSPVIAPARSS